MANQTLVFDIMAREKYLSLRKSTRLNVVSAIEEIRPPMLSTYQQHKDPIIGDILVQGEAKFDWFELGWNPGRLTKSRRHAVEYDFVVSYDFQCISVIGSSWVLIRAFQV